MIIFAYHGTGKTTLLRSHKECIEWDDSPEHPFFSPSSAVKDIFLEIALSRKFHFLNISRDLLEICLKLDIPFLIVLPKEENLSFQYLEKRGDSLDQINAWSRKYYETLDFIKKNGILDFCYFIDPQKHKFLGTEIDKIIKRFVEINSSKAIIDILKIFWELDMFLEKYRLSLIKSSNFSFSSFNSFLRELDTLKDYLKKNLRKQIQEENKNVQ